MARWFACPYLGLDVELTDEREAHIAARHPDLVPVQIDRIQQVLLEPDAVYHGRSIDILIFSRWYDSGRGKASSGICGQGRATFSLLDYHLALLSRGESRSTVMATKLTLRYDKIGDILYIDKVMPYAEQDCDELGDDISARLNPKTGEVENIEILWFTKRLQDGEDVVLPLEAIIRLTVEA